MNQQIDQVSQISSNKGGLDGITLNFNKKAINNEKLPMIMIFLMAIDKLTELTHKHKLKSRTTLIEKTVEYIKAKQGEGTVHKEYNDWSSYFARMSPVGTGGQIASHEAKKQQALIPLQTQAHIAQGDQQKAREITGNMHSAMDNLGKLYETIVEQALALVQKHLSG